MVSVSGIRGRVGEPLTPELAAGIAASFGAFMTEGSRGPICLGRDSRTSGPMLARAVIAGLESVGVDVIDLGVVPTPTLLMAVRDRRRGRRHRGDGEPQPAEWNALKLVTEEGIFLDAERSAAFRKYLAEEDPPRARWDALGTLGHDDGACGAAPRADPRSPARGRRCHPRARLEGGRRLRARRGRAGRGSCSPGSAARSSGIGMEPDGLFPRDPEPTAANLAGLGELVRESGAPSGSPSTPTRTACHWWTRRGRRSART
jgi:phosphomannomutase